MNRMENRMTPTPALRPGTRARLTCIRRPGAAWRALVVALLLLAHAPALAGNAHEAWSAAGARPALSAMLADGALTPAERGIAARLAKGIGTAQEVALPGGPVLSLTPRAGDRDLLATVAGEEIDLAYLWDKDIRVFTQLAMLSEASHRRLRRYAASRFFEFPAQAERLGQTMRQRLEDWYHLESTIGTTRAFMSEVEDAALARLAYEAMSMVAALDKTDIPTDSHDWLRCDFDPAADC